MSDPSLPSRDLQQLQADWLADARARILRNAAIGRRKTVLDLGAGYGFITLELRRRTDGTVIALDRLLHAISSLYPCVCACATHLPFRDHTFDLVFSQNLMLWIAHPDTVAKEVSRVLSPGGAWVLFEPDYGGMIEHPSEVVSSDLWISALIRAGADPMIGRKLPLLLRTRNFNVRTELLPRLETPGIERFEFLSELNLSEEEQDRLQRIQKVSQKLSPLGQIAHLPYFLIIAERA